jgi:hypothetical protein
VTVRLHGTRQEVAEATRRLVEVLDVVSVNAPYPDRGASVLVRVHLEVRLAGLDGNAANLDSGEVGG